MVTTEWCSNCEKDFEVEIDEWGCWECPGCGETIYPEDEDDFGPSPGCRTCGNFDNYPDCYEACPMNPD